MTTIVCSYEREQLLVAISNMGVSPSISPTGPVDNFGNNPFLSDLARSCIDDAIERLTREPYREADVRFAAVLLQIQGMCCSEPATAGVSRAPCNYSTNKRKLTGIFEAMNYEIIGANVNTHVPFNDVKAIFDMAYKSAEPTEEVVKLLRSFLPLLGTGYRADQAKGCVQALEKRVPRPVPDEPASYAIEQRVPRRDGLWERVDGCLWAASQKDVAWARFEKLRTGTDGHVYRFTGIYPQG